jgi:hypothetical protein
MGSFSPAGAWRTLRVLALCAVVAGTIAAVALAAGPGGWDHLGDRGTPGSDSLDLVASALTSAPGVLYVGGEFTDAGGNPAADRIATWNGSSWGAVGSSTERIPDGRVSAIAVSGGKVYAGGTFHDAGGNGSADFLAVWDGVTWEPFCAPTGTGYAGGNVTSLQIVGPTLYVGGEFQNGAGIESADYLLACDLAGGSPEPVVADPAHPFTGPVYALAADSNGTLYAGGNFFDLEDIAAADYVAYLSGGAWHAMGGVTGIVRGLTTVGTDAYVGTDGSNVGGIPQADHVAKWNGSSWSALGAGTGGTNGWFPTTASIVDLAGVDTKLFVTGTFQDANGDPHADHVAFFDGANWHPLGSNGAGDGPFGGVGLAIALVDRQLYAAGNFTTAGGDPQAHSVASFALSQVIAYPTPTVTAGPSAGPTPTVTPGPSAVPTPTVTPAPDAAAPRTSLRKARVDQARRKATFSFASSEPGSRFVCKLDNRRFKSCASPKTYKRLASGAHTFRVKARDRAGNVDASPVVKRFRIRRR